METLLSWLRLTPLAHPFLPATLFFLPVVAASLAIAIGLQRRRGASGLWSFLFPPHERRTADLRTDVGFFLVNRTLYPILVLVWIFEAQGVVDSLGAALAALGVPRPELGWGAGPLAAFTVAIFVARDFGTFLGHWLQHQLPLLWEFHKVHHSTRALTPFSAHRAHPVDDLLTASCSEALAVPVLLAFGWAYGEAVSAWTLLGVHGFVVLFRMAGYHLRHSHVWLSFGPRWGRVLISPAHHQIHHSRAPEHWNRNLGKVLAVWDGLFGTLHVPPSEPQALEFGLEDPTAGAYDSVPRLYLTPFRRSLALLLGALPARGTRTQQPATAP